MNAREIDTIDLESWTEVTVEEISAPNADALATGPFGSSISSRYFQKSGVPVIRGGNLSEDVGTRLNDEGLVFLTPEKAAEFRRSIVREGDLIFTCWGTINQIGLIDARAKYPEYVISNKQMKLTPDPEKVDSTFLYYLFSGPELQKRIKDQSIGSSVPGFNLGQLRSMRLLLPPLPEQRAIADALSAVDALIEKLDALIAKKRAIKTAAMQRLLTGTQRLPGFDGEWTTKRLGDVADIQSGINKPSSAMGSGSLYVTVKDLYAGVSIPISELGRVQLSPTEIEAYSLDGGDIVFGKSSVKREGIGYPNQFQGCREPVAFSGFTYRVRAQEGVVHPKFLFYSLRLRRTRQWLISNSQASALTNINRSIAERIPIAVPTLEEQQAIANILSDMDTEIEALQARRDKTQAIKQGMMQELLTGKTRLV